MSITEVVDPTSVLTAPAPADDESFADELRMNCGLLLGGLDWLISKIFDYDPLQEWVIKPFAGDWTQLGQAQAGWGNAAAASRAIGENFAGLVPQTSASWKGDSGDAFRSRMTQLESTFANYGKGCDQMGEVAGGLIEVSKSTASVISICVGFIGEQLERLAVEMAVPVIGWFAGAFDLAAHAAPIIQRAERIFEALRRLVAAIKDAVEAIRTVAIMLGYVKNMLNTMAGGTNLATAGDVDTAASHNFGTAQ